MKSFQIFHYLAVKGSPEKVLKKANPKRPSSSQGNGSGANGTSSDKSVTINKNDSDLYVATAQDARPRVLPARLQEMLKGR